MRWTRWLVILVVVAAVVLLVAYGFRPRPVPVETAVVKRGPLRITVEEEGKTRVRDRYVVSAPVTGSLRRITLKVGDIVQEGQVTAYLEPLQASVLDARSRAEAQARVAAAEAAVDTARERARAAAADAAYWERQLARVRKLHETGDIPTEQFDRTASEARRLSAAKLAADHAVTAAESELAAAQAALKYSAATPAPNPAEMVAVRAPISGRVLKLVRESEGVVNLGDPLLEIANSRALEVEVEVLSADAVRISPGTRVLFERWGGPSALEGRVRRVEPVAFTKVSALGVEEQRVLVIADFTSPASEWARLGDHYRVDAKFILWEGHDILQIPSSALFRHEDAWAVFCVENGAARRKPVEVGQRNGLAAQVVSGLGEGETVVAHPDSTIEDGKSVRER